MRTHILTALMALILTACASYHRDVASTNDYTENSSGKEVQQAKIDGFSGQGSSVR